jgi:hypothetical protein
MLFWTVVFLTLGLLYFVRGSLFYSRLIKIGELALKIAETNDQSKGIELIKLVAFPFIYSIVMLIVYMIYLFNVIDIDPLKYPTLIIIGLIVINLVKSFSTGRSKIDLSTEESRHKYRIELYTRKRWTIKGILYHIITTGYYTYIIYLLVFTQK